ncbi:serine hydrolase domain-containing protein [Kordiimonas lipolytica]|uniref:Serine hydrolase domain-containing protein n=1 Tax=Kordiimonas lipolytica TaxID=1662421 RepID=A0ABV8UED7_9PROT|nr:serine hydrolase [Kordiimonas lipolytica]
MSVFKKRGFWAVVIIILVPLGYYAVNMGQAFYRMASFYDVEHLTENYRNTKEFFNTTTVHASGTPSAFDYDLKPITDSYIYDGEERSIKDLMVETGTTGLLVAKDGTILFEEYYQGQKADDRHIQFSVTKSFISALFGIAMHDGLIDDLDDPVTKYLPEFKGTGYDGVTLRHVLTMSTGIRFTEDYGDLTSDVNRMSMTIGTGGSLDEFATSLPRDREPGTYNDYVSVNTHVLGMILKRVTGQTITQLLEEKIWQPLGMEQDAYFLIDGHGMEVAMGGLQASLRDMARMGRLYLNEGRWGDEQIVPVEWVKASVTPEAPHLMPGADNPGSETPFGYGYQWWIPTNPHGDFFAAGIYHQFIYVDPTTGIVIAKTSANKGFNDPANKAQKDMIVTAFQAISADLAARETAAGMQSE